MRLYNLLILGFLPSMIEQGGGTIVAVSSLQGRFALPGGSACESLIQDSSLGLEVKILKTLCSINYDNIIILSWFSK